MKAAAARRRRWRTRALSSIAAELPVHGVSIECEMDRGTAERGPHT
jgi:hypothetical protein